MQFDQTLPAGVEVKQQTSGSYFSMLSMGGSTGLKVQFYAGNELLDELRGITRIFSGEFPRPFDRVTFTSTNAATVQFVISDGAVKFQGGDVNATIQGAVNVVNDRGTPGNLLYVSGVSVSDAPATAMTANGPVAMSPTAAVIAAADATRRTLRIANLGTDPMTIGPAGVTWAKRTVTLNAGDVWVEERGANLAWYGITDTAKTASATWQGVTA